MKITTKQMTVTAVMIALCIIAQLFKTNGTYSVWIVGGLVNMFIIIATLYSGWVSGLLISILAPITSFIITASPIIAAVPLIMPCIMVGNLIMVVAAALVRCKRLELNILPISLVAGAIIKYFVMTGLIVKWVIPTYGAALSDAQVVAASAQFSLTQLFAGLVGAFMACVVWPIVKLSVKRSR